MSSTPTEEEWYNTTKDLGWPRPKENQKKREKKEERDERDDDVTH